MLSHNALCYVGHGCGSVGFGHTMSCTDAGQNSQILSYKYHFLSKESPSGEGGQLKLGSMMTLSAN